MSGEVKVYTVEVLGTITRDVKYFDVDAESEASALEIATAELLETGSTYRVGRIVKVESK